MTKSKQLLPSAIIAFLLSLGLAACGDGAPEQQSQNPTTGQTQPSNRDPVQEGSGMEGAPGPAQAQIRIVIRRPGGGQ